MVIGFPFVVNYIYTHKSLEYTTVMDNLGEQRGEKWMHHRGWVEQLNEMGRFEASSETSLYRIIRYTVYRMTKCRLICTNKNNSDLDTTASLYVETDVPIMLLLHCIFAGPQCFICI